MHSYFQRVEDATDGEETEIETTLAWSHEPDLSVEIEFDVTSFRGIKNVNGGGDVTKYEYESVDPFGQVFEIYIDAPMLEDRRRQIDRVKTQWR